MVITRPTSMRVEPRAVDVEVAHDRHRQAHRVRRRSRSARRPPSRSSSTSGRCAWSRARGRRPRSTAPSDCGRRPPRSSEDHLACACLKASFSNVLRAVDVDVQHLERIADVVLDADDGGEVVDEVGLERSGPSRMLEVEDAVAHVVERRGWPMRCRTFAVEPVSSTNDLVAACEERLGEMRADETPPRR